MSPRHANAELVSFRSDALLPSIAIRDVLPAQQRCGITASALMRFRELFKPIAGKAGKSLDWTDAPDQLPEAPSYDSVWDDPSLWMLMMH